MLNRHFCLIVPSQLQVRVEWFGACNTFLSCISRSYRHSMDVAEKSSRRAQGRVMILLPPTSLDLI